VVAWKSGLKVPFLPLGRSCPQQTILLNDLVGCDCPLQIVMAVWRTFFVNLKRAEQLLLSAGTHSGSFLMYKKGLEYVNPNAKACWKSSQNYQYLTMCVFAWKGGGG
jgi:hypothetical protein